MRLILLSLLALLALAAPAAAGPIFWATLSAGASVGSAFAATAVGSFLTGTFLGRVVAAVALSALSRAVAQKPKIRAAGIQTDVTAAGATDPETFLLGWYATGGHAVCPPMSWGPSNAYLVYVIELGGLPGQTLDGLIVDGNAVELTDEGHEHGLSMGGTHAGRGWVRYHDGTQTTADAYLLEHLGAYPERPWTAAMIGTGIPYAVVTFKYDRRVYSGLPSLRFVLRGVPLYDPRLDDTAGGTGPMRRADPATWAVSDNPAVQVYNILAGIDLGGDRWGGAAGPAALPYPIWAAAMDACDASVSRADGTTEPAWRAGFEVAVDADPADVIEEILKGCGGQLAEVGGEWHIRIGPPGLPVLYITDDDIIVSRPQELDPFPGLDRTYNSVAATWPDPAQVWESAEAPTRTNAEWETADGGRRLTADLSLPAVPYGEQVQRIQRAYIEQERRWRRHVLTLPPTAAVLAPLDVIAWTSARNGYQAKWFEVVEIADDLVRGLQQVSLREVDPADYDWTPAMMLPTAPTPSPAPVAPAAVTLAGLALTPTRLADAAGQYRRPALRLIWLPPEVHRQIEWQMRRAGSTIVIASGLAEAAAGVLVLTSGLLPATGYEVRARVVADAEAPWSGWLSATTPDTRLTEADLAPSITDAITAGAARAAEAAGAAQQALTDAAAVQGNLDTAVAGIAADIAGLAEADGTLSASIASLTADLSTETQARVAAVQSEALARTEGDQVLAGQITSLSTTLGSVQSTLATGYYTRAETDQALAAVETALAGQIDGLSADVTQILGLSIDPGSALAVALSDLQTRIGTAEASLTTQGTALATLAGNARAGYLIRAQAGGAVSLLDLVAADGSTGPVSVARLAADDILLDGSVGAAQLVVTDLGGNLIPNGAFAQGDLRGWSTVPGAWALVAKGSAYTARINAPTAHVLQIPTDTVDRTAILGEFGVTEGQRLALSWWLAAGQAGASVSARLVIGWLDATGAVLSYAKAERLDYIYAAWVETTATVTAPAGAVRARAYLTRLAGGAGLAFVTDLSVIRQRSGAVLITPASITGAELITTEALITSSAQIAELTVDTINLAEGAVVEYGVAGGGAVTNNSATPTTICALTLDTTLSNSAIIGQASWTLNAAPTTYPVGFELRTRVNGVVKARITRETLLANPYTRDWTQSFSRDRESGAAAVITMEMVNAGGRGISSFNIWSMAAKK